jgi:hypothetical protein
MRGVSIVGVVAALLVVACKGAAPPAVVAVAVAPPDLAQAPLVCAAIQGCVERCRGDDRACQHACVVRLSAPARPFFERLQACVVPACANADGGAAPCLDPTSFACKLCAMGHCAELASSCLAH